MTTGTSKQVSLIEISDTGEQAGKPKEIAVQGGRNVIFADFMPVQELPDGQVSVSEMLAELSEDPELEEAFSQGRKWGGNVFYKGETSLKSIRLRAGLSQKKLAELVQTSQPHIAKIESGKADPQLSTLKKLATALNVSLADLVEEMS